MSDTTDTRQILEQERRFWDAMRDKNGEAAAEMTDNGCIIVGAQGVSAIDAMQMEKMTAEGKWSLQRYDIDDASAQVRFLSDDIAIVGYKVTEAVTVDGKAMTLNANDASVWVRRAGSWVCALHTESVAGDPFGRQKQ